MPENHYWWQRGIVYQVYPRSFQDFERRRHRRPRRASRRGSTIFVDLGVDAVWISPIYPSPMADFGYDVSDYHRHRSDVRHAGGFRRAGRGGARARPEGHPRLRARTTPPTSTRGSSKAAPSRDNPKRDWYIWRDAKPDGSAPNNWLSEFGGSAWTFDEATGQYYYHAFLKEQPDLNWRNPDVRAAMLEVLRFWLDRGVDGFRVDAIHHLIEAEHLRDNPPNPGLARRAVAGAPARAALFARPGGDARRRSPRCARWPTRYDDRVLIGEASLPIEQLMAYYGDETPGFHLPFNFHLIKSPWEPHAIAALIEQYEGALGGGAERWPNWVLGNHDRSRVASRIGPAQARVAAMLLLTLRGTPTIYQGEEIGMDGRADPDAGGARPVGEERAGARPRARSRAHADAMGRRARTRASPRASRGCRSSSDHAQVNVAAQRADPRSMLSLYRALIALRRREPALSIGVHVKAEAIGAC